jgi:hypothetical protein
VRDAEFGALARRSVAHDQHGLENGQHRPHVDVAVGRRQQVTVATETHPERRPGGGQGRGTNRVEAGLGALGGAEQPQQEVAREAHAPFGRAAPVVQRFHLK